MKAVTNFMGWAALVGGAVLGILSLLGGEVVLWWCGLSWAWCWR